MSVLAQEATNQAFITYRDSKHQILKWGFKDFYDALEHKLKPLQTQANISAIEGLAEAEYLAYCERAVRTYRLKAELDEQKSHIWHRKADDIMELIHQPTNINPTKKNLVDAFWVKFYFDGLIKRQKNDKKTS